MLRLTLTTLTLIVALCAPCAAAPAVEETGEVPFSFEKGFVVTFDYRGKVVILERL